MHTFWFKARGYTTQFIFILCQSNKGGKICKVLVCKLEEIRFQFDDDDDGGAGKGRRKGMAKEPSFLPSCLPSFMHKVPM